MQALSVLHVSVQHVRYSYVFTVYYYWMDCVLYVLFTLEHACMLRKEGGQGGTGGS